MARDVGEHLSQQLHDIGRSAGQLGGDAGVDVGDHGDAGLTFGVGGQLLQRLGELAVRQDSRSQSEDVVAQVADGAVDLHHRSVDPLLELGIAGPHGGSLQVHTYREQ